MSSRGALIEAALEEFADKGYEAAAVAAIAERAGVTTGALYGHFDSKLHLLIESIGLRSIEAIWDELTEIASLPWDEAARELSRGLAERPDRRKLLLLDLIVVARRDPEVAATLRSGLLTHLSTMARATRAGRAAGLIEPRLEPDDLARLFTALSYGLLVIEAIDGPAPSDASFVDLVDVLLQSHAGADEVPTGALARVHARAAASSSAEAALRSAIVDAAADGASLRQIGAAAGLSHERVRRMLNATEAVS